MFAGCVSSDGAKPVARPIELLGPIRYFDATSKRSGDDAWQWALHPPESIRDWDGFWVSAYRLTRTTTFEGSSYHTDYWLDGSYRVVRVDARCLDADCAYASISYRHRGSPAPLGIGAIHSGLAPGDNHAVVFNVRANLTLQAASDGSTLSISLHADHPDVALEAVESVARYEVGHFLPYHVAPHVPNGAAWSLSLNDSGNALPPISAVAGPPPLLHRPEPGPLLPNASHDQFRPGHSFQDPIDFLLDADSDARRTLSAGGCITRLAIEGQTNEPQGPAGLLGNATTTTIFIHVVSIDREGTSFTVDLVEAEESEYSISDKTAFTPEAGCQTLDSSPWPRISPNQGLELAAPTPGVSGKQHVFSFDRTPDRKPRAGPSYGYDDYRFLWEPESDDGAPVMFFRPYEVLVSASVGRIYYAVLSPTDATQLYGMKAPGTPWPVR